MDPPGSQGHRGLQKSGKLGDTSCLIAPARGVTPLAAGTSMLRRSAHRLHVAVCAMTASKMRGPLFWG